MYIAVQKRVKEWGGNAITNRNHSLHIATFIANDMQIQYVGANPSQAIPGTHIVTDD